jgi:hypothetical protein
MSGKKVGVFGIYSTRVAVENATDSLVRAGFPAVFQRNFVPDGSFMVAVLPAIFVLLRNRLERSCCRARVPPGRGAPSRVR